jgi:hypothetical protein
MSTKNPAATREVSSSYDNWTLNEEDDTKISPKREVFLLYQMKS